MNKDISAILSSRWLKGLAALLIIGGYGVWFVLDEQKVRKEAWDGVITEQWEKKPMWHLGGSSNSLTDTKHRRRPTYYWKVQRDDGQLMEVKVPFQLYASAGPGKRVKKIYSERYPRLE